MIIPAEEYQNSNNWEQFVRCCFYDKMKLLEVIKFMVLLSCIQIFEFLISEYPE